MTVIVNSRVRHNYYHKDPPLLVLVSFDSNHDIGHEVDEEIPHVRWRNA